jgi:hypothetical protein
MNAQKAIEHVTPRRKKHTKIVEFPGIPLPSINMAELLARYAQRETKRKKPRYIPTSDAARSRCIHVNSYIVGEHWRRRPSFK